MVERCPVCEAENPPDALDCSRCGKDLRRPGVGPGSPWRLPDLEETLQPAPPETAIEPLSALEPTRLAAPDAPPVAPLEVERTRIEEDDSRPPLWGGAAPDLDSGRADLDGERTPASEDARTCPWCGAEATGALCDACGRRRSRYAPSPASSADAAAPATATVLCPACFTRVAKGPRCVECGVPLRN